MAADELTLKQRQWIKVYLETGNATEAAMQTYDCKDRGSAAQIGYENLRKLDFLELMEESGITDKQLNQTLKEGLVATKPISALVLASTENGTLRTKDNEGQIEVADYAVRHKYLETALKLKGRMVEKKEISGPDGGPIKLDVSSMLDKVYGDKSGRT